MPEGTEKTVGFGDYFLCLSDLIYKKAVTFSLKKKLYIYTYNFKISFMKNKLPRKTHFTASICPEGNDLTGSHCQCQ